MNIYVGNLPYTVTESELERLFQEYGAVSKTIIIMDRETGESKGFGFVEMTNAEKAETAIRSLNDSPLKGRNIKVSRAKPKGEKSRNAPSSAPATAPVHEPRTRASAPPAAIEMDAEAVIDFWFNEIDPASWWRKEPTFDRLIFDRFAAIHAAAVQCELYPWRETSLGRLAEIIILDQFSRNMYRNTSDAFASDPLALALAQEAVARGIHEELDPSRRLFLLMPYMHSESPVIHERAVELFDIPELQQNLDFELKHKSIIDRFGRYPHRNEILGRKSTREELLFLKEPGSSF